MNILIVIPSMNPSQGGPVESVSQLSSELSCLGHRVHILCCRNDDETLESFRKPISDVSMTACIRRYMKGFHFAPGLASELSKLIRWCDIVHLNVPFNYPFTIAGHMAIRMRRTFVVSPRGSLLPAALAKSRLRKEFFLRFIDSPVWAGASTIHVTNQSEAEAIEKLFCGHYTGRHRLPIEVVPNGIRASDFENVDVKDLPPALKERLDERWVSYLGRLHPHKGIDILIAAFSELVRDFRDTHLMLVGPVDKDYEGYLRRYIQKCQVTKKVSFIGPLWGKQKAAFLKQSYVLCLPSRSEGFGNVVLEALVCGTPVIASTGTPWEILRREDCGFWCEATSSDFSHSLRKIFASFELRDLLSNRARSWVKQYFDWRQVAQKMELIYSHAININKKGV